MSFFKKLKNRLFKSSAKIDEGLDAIVSDGGVEEELAKETTDQATAELVAPEPEEPVAPEPTPAKHVPEPEVPSGSPAEPDELPTAPTEPEIIEPVAKVVTQPPEPGPPAVIEEPIKEAPASPEPEVPAGTPAESEVEVEVEVAQKSTPAPIAPVAAALSALDAAQDDAATSQTNKPGLLGRLVGRKEKKTVIRRELDDDMLESLEELLITTDMGVDTALRVTANMAEGRFGKMLSAEEIKTLMAAEITRIMESVAKPMPLYQKKPQVVLVVGVNGSGKTTTIGKLASQFKAAGKTVVIAAGDTFRAAAVEQLQVWGERAGVPVLTAPEGSDPASLAYDAMEQAQRDGADLLMIDTAGRLQNRADLMEELTKIIRVIRKKDETAPHNTLLVLDATTGQNAINQVEVFQKLADVSGLVMTKLDGTAKGGILVALADKFGLPIHAIGVGEQIDDLAPFDPEEFARALTGLET